jgi:DNA repair protein RadA/Sms
VSIRSKRRGGRCTGILTGKSQDAPASLPAWPRLDRVTGGGFVRGSVLLVGGDPGIGKSTLLTQATSMMARAGIARSIFRRRSAWRRCGCAPSGWGSPMRRCSLPRKLRRRHRLDAVRGRGAAPDRDRFDPDHVDRHGGIAPGTVTQVRASAQALIVRQEIRAPIILVGHVTKDGQIAGPRVVEHMVDAVLSFEGEGSQQFRILRAAKNRFGPTDEIGVFEMTGLGLREVSEPSNLFLSERDLGSPGTAVFAGIEGTRPVLVELQALVAPTTLGTPAGPWWAGTRAGCRWCWRCWRPIAGSNCPATTSI